MDFLKKKMKELLDDDKNGDKHADHISSDHARSADHDQPQSYYGEAGSGVAPPQHGYGGPPGDTQLPPGWIQQWDQNSQRFYYLEQATGRTQWETPSFSHGTPSGLPPGGYGHGYAGGYGEQHGGHGGYGDGGQHSHDKDKSSALKYGLGGAAVGALAGGVIAHEMTEDSDDEGHHVTQTTTYAAAPPPASDSYGSAPPPAPTENEDGESISSSEKSEIEERQEELEEAQEEYEAVEEGYES